MIWKGHLSYRKVNKRTGEEVPANRITRGFEHPKGRYVIVSDEDLRRASPERTQRIDILSFTEPEDVDPIYYEHPYYLAPTAKNERATPSCARRSVEPTAPTDPS
jgi:DNA end-binding protein Ku